MKSSQKKPEKITEAELCQIFIDAVAKDGKWTAYPETAGFDILLARKSDGVQIGIEAKLALNAKVISQALPKWLHYDYGITGPDYRAVLVPFGTTGDLGDLCAAIGITVIRVDLVQSRYSTKRFGPELPEKRESYWTERNWHEWAPMKRCHLPDYIPDVAAGAPAPLVLTDWKIKAIKLAVILEERPVTRADFKALGLNPQRWLDPWPGWLKRTEAGFVANRLPDFKAMHPKNYDEIRADKAKWMSALAPPEKKTATLDL